MVNRAGVCPRSSNRGRTCSGLRRAWVGAALLAAGAWLVACGGASTPASPPNPALQPLPPAPPGDPAAEGAPYLALIAARLDPEWRHFLDDCRLRLPAEHQLNSAQLEATASLVAERDGRLSAVELAGSGNADFDQAVREVLSAVSPLPTPPAWLLSDDDKLRLRWRFARDHRQAGAAGGQVVWQEQPAVEVVARRLSAGDLEGAARRVARLPDGDPALGEQARVVLQAAIAEGLGGDVSVQREAVEAARRAGLRALAPRLLPLAQGADPALRGKVAAALAELAEPSTIPALIELLGSAREPALAVALARALVATGMRPAAEAGVLQLVTGDRESVLAAVAALGELPMSPALAQLVTRWSTSKDPLVRGALCATVARAKVPAATRWDILGRGMGDRDGSARAACTGALAELATRPLPWMRFALTRLIEDRDQRVRAAALTAMLRWDAGKLDERLRTLAQDKDPQVRVAIAPGLAARRDAETLRALVADPDAAVRRAAAQALLPLDEAFVGQVAVGDADARVRLVALGAAEPSAVLRALAEDESLEVRAEVEIKSVAQRGESLQNGLLRVAGASAASAERVRVALAWLLAL